MTVLYLMCLTTSITALAMILLRPHPTPEPPIPPAPVLAADADQLQAVSRLLRVTADQIDAYHPAA